METSLPFTMIIFLLIFISVLRNSIEPVKREVDFTFLTCKTVSAQKWKSLILFYFLKPDRTVWDFDANKLVVVQIMEKAQWVLKDTLHFIGLLPHPLAVQ